MITRARGTIRNEHPWWLCVLALSVVMPLAAVETASKSPYAHALVELSSQDRETLEQEFSPSYSADEVGRRADASGDPQWHLLAGKVYESSGADSNPAKAREYYQKAADAGQPEAMLRMAWFLVSDKDDATNRQQALQMALRAAESGNVTARIGVASMLALGFGGEAKRPAGIRDLKEEAEKGDPQAQFALGTAYLNGDFGEKNLNEGYKWNLNAANQDFIPAAVNVGICYAYGLGVAPSAEEAFRWYLKAAELGDGEAEHNVGNAFLNGRGVPKNMEMAGFWFRRSAKKGNAESMAALAVAELNVPDPAPEVREDALRWLRKADELGSPLAKFTLAILCLDGNFVPHDVPKGIAWLEEAANAGFPPAQLHLAHLLRFGLTEGLPSDPVEAAKWCILASNAQLAEAGELLELIYLNPAQREEAVKRAEAFRPRGKDFSLKGIIKFNRDFTVP